MKLKIFTAILSANLLLVLCMYLVSAWSFQNGFLEYVNRTELNKLEALAKALQTEYAQQKSWEFLKRNRRHWLKLQEQYLLDSVELNESTLLRSPFKLEDNRPQRKRERIILLDQKKNLVIGARQIEDQAVYKPIMYNNRIVGYLGIQQKLELSHQLDRIFSQQQQLNLILIAFGSILISIIIALPFSAKLIKPIVNLLQATLLLSKGDYSQRVENMSKDEIGQLSNAFNEMAENLEKQGKIQQQWLADISHELRTPLTVVKAETEAMLDGVRPIKLENIQSIQQELNHLNALVEDLHELSAYELQAIKLHKNAIYLNEIIEELLTNFEQEIENRSLVFHFPIKTSQTLLADQTKITQVFINLIQNNLRYTKIGGEIFISISFKNNQVTILWEDNGPGVSDENLGKLFDRLYRVDSSRNSHLKGSGLGLSICRSIINSHEGTIKAFSSKQGGLGIEIKLPNNH